MTRRDLRHVRSFVCGDPCPHRKWGQVYDSYATTRKGWDLQVWGRWRHLQIAGCLFTCDLCQRRLLRWPGWTPRNPYAPWQ